MPLTDAGLIHAARAGHKEAFAELIRRYQGLVYGLAYHRVGNFTDAEDMGTGALKERAFETMCRTLRTLGAEVKQVVLRLSGADQCQAAVSFTCGGAEFIVNMRPSDAFCLTNLMTAPIYADEAVVLRGSVGEDDIPAPKTGEQTITAEHK